MTPDDAPVLLRLLATSDVHMHLYAHDYFSDTPRPARALEDLAGQITAQREDATAQGGVCLLLDNGDILQGTPLADHLAETPDAIHPHPVARMMDALGYDALGLGNHEFDYGLDYLASFARDLSAPVLSSNLHLHAPADWLQPRVILERGGLRIGLLSVLPERTLTWAHAHLSGRALMSDMATACRETARTLRQDGADVVVALAHTGLGAGADENALARIAEDGAVDALIGGHTHEHWPRSAPDAPQDLHGVPTVMPGYAAEALGRIDLHLSCDSDGKLRIDRASACLLPPLPQADEDEGQENRAPAAFAPLHAPHQATRQKLAHVVGHTAQPLTSYTAQVAPTRMLEFAAAATMRGVTEAHRNSSYADLPLLAAVSPARAGGGGGPQNYADIPAGPLRRRQVSELHVYPNRIWAVPVSGAELKAWLERSAGAFTEPEARDSHGLVCPLFPAFDFDVIYGVTYEIDPMVPARYDQNGRLTGPSSHRIHALRLNGRPVVDTDRFLVATSNFRASGGGKFPGLHADRDMLRTQVSAAQAVQEFISQGVEPDLPCPWRFAETAAGTRTWFDTGPGARAYLHEIAHLSPEIEGMTPEGFLRVGISL